MRALACEGFPGHFSVHGLMGRFWGTQGALALADKVIGAALMYPSILLHQGLMEPLLYRCIKTMVVMVVIFEP